MSEISGVEISSLLPHGRNMCLIDRVLHWDEKKIQCKTLSHTNKDNPLRVNNNLPVTAYLEYAAQAAGLHLGLSHHQTDKVPAAGYVGTLKDIRFYFVDPVMDELCISADMLIREQKNAIYYFSIESSTSPIVDGRISLSQA